MTADAPVAPTAPPALGSPEWGGFDPARTRGRGLRDLRRSFMTAARLGWQTEANWTDPILFFIYSVAKPLSTTLIFVVMIEVIGGAATREFRGFVVVGTALWAFVIAGIGIANEYRWAYNLAIGVSVAAIVVPLVLGGIDIIFSSYLITLLFDVALFALLVHPQSRDHQRIWFH